MVIIKTFLEGLRLFAGMFSKRPEAVTSGLFIWFEKLTWLRDQSVRKRRKQRKKTRHKENEEVNQIYPLATDVFVPVGKLLCCNTLVFYTWD